ncbi:MAG: hypothetical protein DCC48_11165 [Acidobacteria bacterium]|nr:MAG: hypothetical protein DCC48_11165 [Acidobacteriota bacterium]
MRFDTVPGQSRTFTQNQRMAWPRGTLMAETATNLTAFLPCSERARSMRAAGVITIAPDGTGTAPPSVVHGAYLSPTSGRRARPRDAHRWPPTPYHLLDCKRQGTPRTPVPDMVTPKLRGSAALPALSLLPALLLLAGACATTDDPTAEPAPIVVDDEGSTPTTTPDGSSDAPSADGEPLVADIDAAEFELTEIAELDELEEPIALAAHQGSPNLYIAERQGRIWEVEVNHDEERDTYEYDLGSSPILDISAAVGNTDGEKGLLGIAFSSDGRRLFVSYTQAADGSSRVEAYDFEDGDVDEDSAATLLTVEQPFPNHNGGHLVIGPDGFLYFGLGDGGGEDDPDDNGQDPNTLLGTILRMDPEEMVVSPSGEVVVPYGIPESNPFVGDDNGRDEVWLYGVRNPWRFSFDKQTGDLWIGDVGQNEIEEIDLLPFEDGYGIGANLGWRNMEGSNEYLGPEPDGHVGPIFEYSHEGGNCSVTGGYVYRGTRIPSLQGVYLFSDLCEAGIRGIVAAEGELVAERTFDVGPSEVYSFGEASDGELYVLSAGSGVYRIDPVGTSGAAESEGNGTSSDDGDGDS